MELQGLDDLSHCACLFLLYLGHMYGNASCMGSLALLRNSNGSLQFLFVCLFFIIIIIIIIIIIKNEFFIKIL